MVKRSLVLLLLGAFAGLVASMALGPSFVAWRYRPPGHAAGPCDDLVGQAMRSLIELELAAGLVGAVFFVVAGSLALRRRPAPALEPK